ncbi:Acetyltransferase (GNAT) family protein [Jatrophihabitans endophyticus]|uniref:Acetyltransferase (GNAT) family protein n=1 Tax=Jatrophihabitans endophyticus TaxID=1206085 RepID=A0A1M5L7K6_9ACTN|nr:GNAT family N-acetyltransferase [Jatrophihabitans endophyticus]SHG60729.1 Acetyltransferase (GNAT) family protein [Jatrophihabitans endophyticus]
MRSAERQPTTGVRVVPWTGDQFGDRVDEAMAIYVAAMGYPEYTGAQRAVSARKHVAHEGFACRAALLPDDTLVGFAYGYTTAPGQWWHDLVRRALAREHNTEWLDDAFELSELHVLPEHQGAGLGREVLLSLAGSLAHRAVLLSTPDSDTRAFRMYRSLGFVDLARNYLFPGDARPFAVLGASLPLTTATAD